MKTIHRKTALAGLFLLYLPAWCILAGLYKVHQALTRALGPLLVCPLRLYDNPTLTTSEVLQDVIDAFKNRLPAIMRLGIDFKTGPLKYKQEAIAHIAGIPTTSTYDAANGGYANGVQNARSLLTDIKITPDQWITCPLKWLHVDNIKDRKQEYGKIIGNAGYAMARQVVDYVLGLITAANFSQNSIYAIKDSDSEMLNAICGAMNLRQVAEPRTLFVNTPVAGTLNADPRITSADYAGQLQGGKAFRRWTNTHGFEEIIEYPGLLANGENLSAFAFEARALAVLAGPPEDNGSALCAQLGIQQVMAYETLTDEDTGITFAAVSWQQAGTGDLYWCPTVIFGAKAGARGGAAVPGTLLDYAGHRIATPAEPPVQNQA